MPEVTLSPIESVGASADCGNPAIRDPPKGGCGENGSGASKQPPGLLSETGGLVGCGAGGIVLLPLTPSEPGGSAGGGVEAPAPSGVTGKLGGGGA